MMGLRTQCGATCVSSGATSKHKWAACHAHGTAGCNNFVGQPRAPGHHFARKQVVCADSHLAPTLFEPLHWSVCSQESLVNPEEAESPLSLVERCQDVAALDAEDELWQL